MLVAAAVMIVLGTMLVAASIVFQWRHVPYGLGLTALAIGSTMLVGATIRRAVWNVVASVAVAVLVVTSGVAVIGGSPSAGLPRWDQRAFEGVSSWSARTGNLLVSGGTAYDVRSGKVVWSVPDRRAEPALVRSDIVVLRTGDETVAHDTTTGDVLWRSPVTGPGIATSDDTLVISHPVSDSEFEAVALDVTTGAVVWRRPGEPVMECDLGPINTYSVALEQTHVLVENDKGQTELLSVADGKTTTAVTDCWLSARMVGGILVESTGKSLQGRSPADGKKLWSTPIGESWTLQGGGSEVFTFKSNTSGAVTQLSAVDVTTGRPRIVDPPAGEVRPLSSNQRQRTSQVWVLVNRESGPAVWNPATDALVEIPDAESIDDLNADVHSGWIALSGRTRDITGDVTRLCWALSPAGVLSDPVPGPGCYVDEGIMEAGRAVYPLT
ncbi:hypothetical protein MMM2322_01995 [Microbacterium sp. MM2322]